MNDRKRTFDGGDDRRLVDISLLADHGHYGTVYAARYDDGKQESVVVKVARAPVDENVHQRFQWEAQVLSRLRDFGSRHTPALYHRHPGLVPNDPPYLVMDIAPGMKLSSFILEDGRRGTVEEGTALEIARQLAETLQIAHRSGYAYADWKDLSNLFWDWERHHLTLIDWNQAREVAPASQRENLQQVCRILYQILVGSRLEQGYQLEDRPGWDRVSPGTRAILEKGLQPREGFPYSDLGALVTDLKKEEERWGSLAPGLLGELESHLARSRPSTDPTPALAALREAEVVLGVLDSREEELGEEERVRLVSLRRRYQDIHGRLDPVRQRLEWGRSLFSTGDPDGAAKTLSEILGLASGVSSKVEQTVLRLLLLSKSQGLRGKVAGLPAFSRPWNERPPTLPELLGLAQGDALGGLWKAEQDFLEARERARDAARRGDLEAACKAVEQREQARDIFQKSWEKVAGALGGNGDSQRWLGRYRDLALQQIPPAREKEEWEIRRDALRKSQEALADAWRALASEELETAVSQLKQSTQYLHSAALPEETRAGNLDILASTNTLLQAVRHRHWYGALRALDHLATPAAERAWAQSYRQVCQNVLEYLRDELKQVEALVDLDEWTGRLPRIQNIESSDLMGWLEQRKAEVRRSHEERARHQQESASEKLDRIRSLLEGKANPAQLKEAEAELDRWRHDVQKQGVQLSEQWDDLARQVKEKGHRVTQLREAYESNEHHDLGAAWRSLEGAVKERVELYDEPERCLTVLRYAIQDKARDYIRKQREAVEEKLGQSGNALSDLQRCATGAAEELARIQGEFGWLFESSDDVQLQPAIEDRASSLRTLSQKLKGLAEIIPELEAQIPLFKSPTGAESLQVARTSLEKVTAALEACDDIAGDIPGHPLIERLRPGLQLGHEKVRAALAQLILTEAEAARKDSDVQGVSVRLAELYVEPPPPRPSELDALFKERVQDLACWLRDQLRVESSLREGCRKKALEAWATFKAEYKPRFIGKAMYWAERTYLIEGQVPDELEPLWATWQDPVRRPALDRGLGALAQAWEALQATGEGTLPLSLGGGQGEGPPGESRGEGPPGWGQGEGLLAEGQREGPPGDGPGEAPTRETPLEDQPVDPIEGAINRLQELRDAPPLLRPAIGGVKRLLEERRTWLSSQEHQRRVKQLESLVQALRERVAQGEDPTLWVEAWEDVRKTADSLGDDSEAKELLKQALGAIHDRRRELLAVVVKDLSEFLDSPPPSQGQDAIEDLVDRFQALLLTEPVLKPYTGYDKEPGAKLYLTSMQLGIELQGLKKGDFGKTRDVMKKRAGLETRLALRIVWSSWKEKVRDESAE